MCHKLMDNQPDLIQIRVRIQGYCYCVESHLIIASMVRFTSYHYQALPAHCPAHYSHFTTGHCLYSIRSPGKSYLWLSFTRLSREPYTEPVDPRCSLQDQSAPSQGSVTIQGKGFPIVGTE